MIVTEPWQDKNALKDALRIGIPVIAFCDTNNECNNIDLVLPCNNKGKKSLGLIYWVLARDYLQHRKQPFTGKIEDFSDE